MVQNERECICRSSLDAHPKQERKKTKRGRKLIAKGKKGQVLLYFFFFFQPQTDQENWTFSVSVSVSHFWQGVLKAQGLNESQEKLSTEK